MTKNEVATKQTTGLSTDVMSLLEENAGLGLDTLDDGDKIIAQLKIAQMMSPQLKKSDAKYIAGLSGGDMFNAATSEVYGPIANIAVLGVYKALTVWGTLEDTSSEPPLEVVLECVNPRRYAEIKSNLVKVDNMMVLDKTKKVNESFRIAAMVIRPDNTFDPVMIECAKTRFKNARQLNTLLDSARVTIGNKVIKPPACAVMITMEVVEASKDGNSWFEFRFSRNNDHELLNGGIFGSETLGLFLSEAKLLKESLIAGDVKLSSDEEVAPKTTTESTNEVIVDGAESVFG